MLPQSERTSVQFTPLARIPIKQGTYLVFSLRSDGNVSIAQQVEMQSGNKIIHIYLKNAIEIPPTVLYDILDATKEAIGVLFQSP